MVVPRIGVQRKKMLCWMQINTPTGTHSIAATKPFLSSFRNYFLKNSNTSIPTIISLWICIYVSDEQAHSKWSDASLCWVVWGNAFCLPKQPFLIHVLSVCINFTLSGRIIKKTLLPATITKLYLYMFMFMFMYMFPVLGFQGFARRVPLIFILSFGNVYL